MNKANQFLSERFGLALPTDYGHDFNCKRRQIETRKKLADKFKLVTRRFLFPNHDLSKFHSNV